MVRLIPKDNSFFAMFSAMSDNLIAGARTLVDLFANYHDVGSKIDEIHRIEREGDELTHAILTKAQPDIHHTLRPGRHSRVGLQTR